MTISTGEDRSLDPAAAQRRIPKDTFGNRLMLARALAGHLSIREAADLCGLGRGAWTNWERGARPVGEVAILDVISEKLDVDRKWLERGGALAAPERTYGQRPRGNRSDRATTLYRSDHHRLTPTRPPGHPDGLRRPAARPHPIAA